MPAKAILEESEISVEEPATTEEDTLQEVVFTLAGEDYGVDILEVRRIIKAESITMIPNAPDFLRGVINLRSQIVGVIDLEKRFLLKRDEEYVSKHILIVEMGNSTYGLLVDEVTEILRLPKKNIKPAPKIITEKLGAEFVKGVGTVGDKLVILLDLERVLSEKELVELSKMSTKHYRTIGLKKKEEKATEQKASSHEELPKKKRTTESKAPLKAKMIEKPVGQAKGKETMKSEVSEEKLVKE